MGIERNDAIKIVDQFFALQRSYALEARWIVSPERYTRMVEAGIIVDWEPDNEATREPLLEHVGHLPVLATFLYPHAEHKEKIDLGRVLIMLAIHDIGETTKGDVFAYDKTSEDEKGELEAARLLLPPELFTYYEEFENWESMDAKFAKAIDALAPLFHELVIPAEVTQKRFKMYGFDVDKIEKRKRPHVDWDSNLNAVFDDLMARYT
ncbi:MAG: HD domain-containing protein [Patescibacteria group bacterium]